MLESISEAIPIENIPAKTKFPWLTTSQLNWLNDPPKKRKKGKKSRRSRKKERKNYKYAQLAFQYGVLVSRYDTLTRMVQLAVSTQRRQLNDDLLDDGLAALRPPCITSLPEL